VIHCKWLHFLFYEDKKTYLQNDKFFLVDQVGEIHHTYILRSSLKFLFHSLDLRKSTYLLLAKYFFKSPLKLTTFYNIISPNGWAEKSLLLGVEACSGDE